MAQMSARFDKVRRDEAEKDCGAEHYELKLLYRMRRRVVQIPHEHLSAGADARILRQAFFGMLAAD